MARAVSHHLKRDTSDTMTRRQHQFRVRGGRAWMNHGARKAAVGHANESHAAALAEHHDSAGHPTNALGQDPAQQAGASSPNSPTPSRAPAPAISIPPC